MSGKHKDGEDRAWKPSSHASTGAALCAVAVRHGGRSATQSSLDRFAREQGPGGLRGALLARHGPLVLGVCRRVLGNASDADDAFQATFLVMLRRASISRPVSPGAVALRRRVPHRARLVPVPPGAAPSGSRRRGPSVAPTQAVRPEGDLQSALDEAVRWLPARYREPVILCYLQGLTNAQAAERLGCPPGTVATRLARTRQATGLAHGPPAAGSPPRRRCWAPPSRRHLARRLRGRDSGAHRADGFRRRLGRDSFSSGNRRVREVSYGEVELGGHAHGLWGRRPGPGHRELSRWGKGDAGCPRKQLAESKPSARVPRRWTPQTPTSGSRPRPLRLAAYVARAAERHRKEVAVARLGRELPDWPGPRPIRVTLTEHGSSGATTFQFDRGRVASQSMSLEGPLERILTCGAAS